MGASATTAALPDTTDFRSSRLLMSSAIITRSGCSWSSGLSRPELRAAGPRAGVRHPPCQDMSGEPVEHGSEIDEPTRHGNVGNVHRPDRVGPGDGQLPEQIRV